MYEECGYNCADPSFSSTYHWACGAGYAELDYPPVQELKLRVICSSDRLMYREVRLMSSRRLKSRAFPDTSCNDYMRCKQVPSLEHCDQGCDVHTESV